MCRKILNEIYQNVVGNFMDSYTSIDFSLLYALNLITTFDCEGFFLQNTFALYLMVPPGDMLTLGVDGENA